MTLDGLDADFRTVGLQLVELAGCSLGVNLTINQRILVVGLVVLRVGIDSLVVLGCCCTAIVGQGLDVAEQDVGGCTLVLAGYQGVVGIHLGIGGVLGLEEGASEGDEVGSVLLVLLVEGLHLLVEVGGFATNNFLYGIYVGCCAVLRHY